jgi:hypothetical protein
VASHRYVPALVVVKRSELSEVPLTDTVETKTVVEQFRSDGPNNLKVTDPVGLAVPFKLTLANTWRPTVVDVDAVIVICGVERPCADAAAGNAPKAKLAPTPRTMRTEAIGTTEHRRRRAWAGIFEPDVSVPLFSRGLMIAMTTFRIFLVSAQSTGP